ncbi:MAG: AAA family ATPase, partial [Candidatus Paceibacterota bacterium]
MILLKNLIIQDFLSHSDTIINFKKSEKLLISGKSGGGKSAIVESILFALYGEGRNENRSLIRRGTKTATVSLKLADGELETIITRSVSNTGKNTLIVTQNTGSKKQFLPIERVGLKDTQDWITNTFLKASYELFINSVAYPQDNENSFVKANAGRRKDLLLEIIRAGDFDQLYEKTRNNIKNIELENAITVTKIQGLENTVKNSEEAANRYDFHKKEVDGITLKIENLTLVEKDLENITNNISHVVQQIESKKTTSKILEDNISSINDQLLKDKQEVERYEKIDIKTAAKDVEEMDLVNNNIEEIETELKKNLEIQQHINAHLANKPSTFDYTKDIEIINKRLIPLIKDTGKCPAGDACPFVVPIKGQIDFLTEQITEKTEKIVSEKKALETWEIQYANLV